MVTADELTLRNEHFEFAPIIDSEGAIAKRALERSSEQWRGNITHADYVRREKILNNAKIAYPGSRKYFSLKSDTSNGPGSNFTGVWTFVLKDLSLEYTKEQYPNDTPETFNIVSAMDLLVRDAYRISTNGSNVSVNPVIFKTQSGVVGTVFTVKKHRGKGYAKQLLSFVNQWSKKFLNFEDQEKMNEQYGFTTLYSEIGEYYSQFGYVSKHVPLIKIPIKEISEVLGSLDYNHTRTEILSKGQFTKHAEKTNELMVKRHQTSTSKDGRTRLFTQFNSDIIDWFHLRSEFYNFCLNGGKCLWYGLQLIDTNVPETVLGYVVWTYNFNDKFVDILKLDVFQETPKGQVYAYQKLIAELINHLATILDDDTKKFFENGIKLWESAIPEHVTNSLEFQGWLVGDLKATINIKNTSSLSAIHSANSADQEGIANGDLVWENNEKWCWF